VECCIHVTHMPVHVNSLYIPSKLAAACSGPRPQTFTGHKLACSPHTFVAVRQEESPAPLAVEGREVVHDHPRIFRDAATKHTHREAYGNITEASNFHFSTDNWNK